MKLYVVRHGETVENSNNCLVGRINIGLTEQGFEQAKEVAKYFIDRLVQILTNSENIKDCVLFPLIRPMDKK